MKNTFEYLDGKLFWKISPNNSIKIGDEAGSTILSTNKKTKRVKIGFKGNSYMRSHIIWYLHHGYMPNMLDHIDGNTLNDSIGNLRECTQQTNMQNLFSNRSKIGYKGVSKVTGKSNSYRARITVNGKQIQLGTSRDPVECAKMYDKAALKYFGDFANTNF